MANKDASSAAGDRDAVRRLWAVAHSTEFASTTLAARRGLDGDLRFTVAASHCAEAADGLQRVHRDIGDAVNIWGDSVDFRLAPIDDATDALLAALADGIASFAVDDPGLTPSDVMAAGTAVTWLAMAYYAISGRLP